MTKRKRRKARESDERVVYTQRKHIVGAPQQPTVIGYIRALVKRSISWNY